MLQAMESYNDIDETVREIAAYIIQNGSIFQNLYNEMCTTEDVDGVLNNNDDTLQLAFKCGQEIKKGLNNSKNLSRFNLDPLTNNKIDLGKFGMATNKGTDLARIVRDNYAQYKNHTAQGDAKPTIAQFIDSRLAGAETIPESEKVKAFTPSAPEAAAESPAAEISVANPPVAPAESDQEPQVQAQNNDDIKQRATEILNEINQIDDTDNDEVILLKNQAKRIHQAIMDDLVTDISGLTETLNNIKALVATENTSEAEPAAQPVAQPAAPVTPTTPTTPATPAAQPAQPATPATPAAQPAAPAAPTPAPVVPEPSSNDTDDSPQVVDIETDYPDVVEFIRRAQMSKSQGDHMIEMANYALNDPSGDQDTTELASAVRNFGPNSVDVIYDRLDMINPTLGHKVTPYKPTRNIKFSKPTMMQSSRTRSVSTGLVTPEGFGTSINSNIWNKPVITEFGFPFLNISSEAITLLFKSKGETQQAAYKKFKSMLKAAVKTYGGIWKAIYKAPLDVLKQFANDPGTRCVANMLKVDGDDLLGSDFESTVSVTPINYYSVDASYNKPTPVPREYLTSFYTVLDYTQADRATYLQYADGMTANEFVEATSQNNGIPPFYLLVPKSGSFSKCEMKPTGVIGSFINLFGSAKNCVLLKTYFNKRKGCFLMEKQVADALYADLQ